MAKTVCGRGLLEMSSQKIKIAKTDRKLYPVVVRDMDNIEKRVKIHYVEYSERYGDWQPCDTEDSNPPFQWVESLRIPSSTSLEDPMELVHGELYREIKRKLYSGQKDDPATRVEIRIDQDVFDEGLALAGKPSKERGKTVYRIDSNEALKHSLGIKWDERIFNKSGDFAFVIEKTVRFWLSRETAIQEFKVIGGKYVRSEIEDNL